MNKYNHNGNVFVISLVTLAIVIILATITPSLIKSGLQQTKLSRLRSQMRVVETRLRSQMNQPSAYVGCDSLVGATSSCKISRNLLIKFIRNLAPGTKCSSAAANCGIELFATNFTTTPTTSIPINFNIDLPITQISQDSKSAKVDLMLKYTGDDLSIKDTHIELHIPFDILQSHQFDCGLINPTKPIFTGFNTSGIPICRGVNNCGPGEFIQSINPQTLEITCGTISGTPSCAGGEMLSSLEWSSGNTFSYSCSNRLNPYDIFTLDTDPTVLPPVLPVISPAEIPSPTPSLTISTRFVACKNAEPYPTLSTHSTLTDCMESLHSVPWFCVEESVGCPGRL